ncbi:ubp1-associated protein 2a, partial [Quercus suber]
STSTSVDTHGDDNNDEPQILLEPFSKDQIINLLYEATDKHRDVADQIRKVVDEDPTHRKIFIHGLGWDTTVKTLIAVFKEWVF